MKKIFYKTNQNDPQIKAYKEALERGKKNQHVVPTKDGWAVKHEGLYVSRDIFSTQEEAIKAARKIAGRRNDGELIIHGSDGRVRFRESYGNDPFPPRDIER